VKKIEGADRKIYRVKAVGMRDVDPSNEALQQLRPFWHNIIILTKLGLQRLLES